MTLYIAQVNYNYNNPKLTEEFLLSLFEPFGKIESLAIATEEYTKNHKSFAYVTLTNDEDSINAIKKLNLRYNNYTKSRLVIKKANDYTIPKDTAQNSKNYHYIFI